MQVVRARTRSRGKHPSARAAELARKVVGYYFELLNGFKRRAVGDIVSRAVARFGAIEKNLAGIRSAAVDDGPRAAAALRKNAGREQDERVGIAAE